MAAPQEGRERRLTSPGVEWDQVVADAGALMQRALSDTGAASEQVQNLRADFSDRLAPMQPGSYEICSCRGDCEGSAEFATKVASFLLEGPHLGQSFGLVTCALHCLTI